MPVCTLDVVRFPPAGVLEGVIYLYGPDCPCSFHLSHFTDEQVPHGRVFFNLPLLPLWSALAEGSSHLFVLPHFPSDLDGGPTV
jgi:hypothetical protein